MMRFRRDEQVIPVAGATVLWAFDLLDHKQVLLMLYPLSEQNRKVGDGMTHEFSVFEIDPNTRIDISENLFTQPAVSPLVPGLAGYQFSAVSDLAASARLGDVALDLATGVLNPFDDECWAVRFRDGERVDLDTQARDLNLTEGEMALSD